jgi:hypothetical protein
LDITLSSSEGKNRNKKTQNPILMQVRKKVLFLAQVLIFANFEAKLSMTKQLLKSKTYVACDCNPILHPFPILDNPFS